MRLQDLRGTYGIAAPAPICADRRAGDGRRRDCQVVHAPPAPAQRLVPRRCVARCAPRPAGADGEIRLTYRELTALIEDAVRSLR